MGRGKESITTLEMVLSRLNASSERKAPEVLSVKGYLAHTALECGDLGRATASFKRLRSYWEESNPSLSSWYGFLVELSQEAETGEFVQTEQMLREYKSRLGLNHPRVEEATRAFDAVCERLDSRDGRYISR